MTRLLHRTLGWCLVCSLALGARPGEVRTPELDRDRDGWLEKLVRGEDVDEASRQLVALVRRRDERFATSYGAKKREREAQEARRAWQKRWSMSGDEELSSRCQLTSLTHGDIHSGGYRFDWGRLTRVEEVRVPGERRLDEDQTWQLYEVEGQDGRVRFGGRAQRSFKGLERAQPGMLVGFCKRAASAKRGLPDEWREGFAAVNFAVALHRPPPRFGQGSVHLSGSKLYWAARSGDWPLPPGTTAVMALELDEDLGQGRWKIEVRAGSVVLDIPEKVRQGRELAPGRTVWVELTTPKVDEAAKQLVLTARGLELELLHELAADEALD